MVPGFNTQTPEPCYFPERWLDIHPLRESACTNEAPSGKPAVKLLFLAIIFTGLSLPNVMAQETQNKSACKSGKDIDAIISYLACIAVESRLKPLLHGGKTTSAKIGRKAPQKLTVRNSPTMRIQRPKLAKRKWGAMKVVVARPKRPALRKLDTFGSAFKTN